jgi:hypothetical protein
MEKLWTFLKDIKELNKWRELVSVSIGRKTQYPNDVILPKLVYKFNIMQIQSQEYFVKP